MMLESFLVQIVIYTTVYTLATLGIVIAGRTGIFIVAGEGIMLSSASAGFIVAYLSGSWVLGFVIGALMGALFGLILIVLHETFLVSQFILGICLVILGLGLSDLLYKIIIGIMLTPPLAPLVPKISIPLLSSIPVAGALFRHDLIVYFMYLATFAAYWFFYKTRLGLETRAIGENPKAADVVGVNVKMRRFVSTIVGAALIGIAGAYLPIIVTKAYAPEISAGRGFMAIGIAIFASWKPQRAILGGFLFAAIEVISYQLQLSPIGVPYQFFLMLPFVSVLLIMMIFKKKVEFPESIGKPYSRE
ncbi:MAG: ABC transporter permease [Bacillota bacterium]|nr:ABC transporter permease [Bacillota bacterium]